MPTYNSQRDCMRSMIKQFGPQEDVVVREYAASERRGEVSRKSNVQRIDAEKYARALWADGARKGWF